MDINWWEASFLGDDFYSNAYDDFTFEYDDFYDWVWEIEDENDWGTILEEKQTYDFSDIPAIINPTQEELKYYGHQAEDFILPCTFDKRKCNYT